MKKDWYTGAELAGLPGLPGTDRHIRRMAEAKGWITQPRQRGKGLEYHISNLSAQAVAALHKRELQQLKQQQQCAQDGGIAGRELAIAGAIDTATAQRQREQGLRDVLALNPQAMTRADARLAILAALDDFTRSSPLSASKAVVAFCAQYNEGSLVDTAGFQQAASKTAIPDIHPASIYRWRKMLQQDGAAALAGKYQTGKRSLVDTQPALQQFVLAMLTDYPHASAAHVHTACAVRFKGTTVMLPSERRLRIWIASWKQENRQLFTAIANPDAWKSKYMLAMGSASEDITRLNQRWEMDSTPADVELIDGRHCIIGVIDVWSRRPLMLVSKTSKATAVALAFRQALLGWGVPELVKTDNGSDYTSKHMIRVVKSLDVIHDLCEPFSGWQKPHIERFFRTFSHGLVELLPNYIGHNVADRQALRARQSFAERLFTKNSTVSINMTAAELQAFCDKWIDGLYMHRRQSALQCKPIEMLAKWRDGIRAINDERALDVLLAEVPRGDGMCTITKKGLTIDGIQYIAAEFGELAGERVHVRFSEKLGLVYVFHHGQFVCIAEAPAYRDIDRKEVAAIAKRKQATREQEMRAELKAAARKEKTRHIADEILDSHAQENRALVHLPHRRTEHMTADLAAAALAAAEYTPARAKAEVKPMSPAKTAPAVTDPRENHAAWLRIEMRIVQGQWVSPQERDGLAIYKQSDECRSMEQMFSAFNLDANSF